MIDVNFIIIIIFCYYLPLLYPLPSYSPSRAVWSNQLRAWFSWDGWWVATYSAHSLLSPRWAAGETGMTTMRRGVQDK